MQLTYISLAALGLVITVMALPAQQDVTSLKERSVCWCSCGSKPNGYCIVGPGGCGLVCETGTGKKRTADIVQV